MEISAGTAAAANNHFYMNHCMDGASGAWSYSSYGSSGTDTNTQEFMTYSQSASAGGTHGAGYQNVNPFTNPSLTAPSSPTAGHMILFGSTLGTTSDGGAPPATTAVYTYGNCTTNCAGLSANQAAQTMVSSVPGSNGVQYAFKGELAQASTGTTCSGSSTVQLKTTYTDQITGNSFTQNVPIRLAGSPTTFSTTFTGNLSGSGAIGSFDFQFTAKSGTSITWSATNYMATCGTNWTYTVLPFLQQENAM
jgi:hypothetical protein